MAKKMSVESGADRISALPNELLCLILSFLPTVMAIRTSILSKRWRCLYTLVSTIDFDDADESDDNKTNQFANFVERVFRSPNRPSIQRFRLKWHHNIDLSQIGRWIEALTYDNAQEIELCNNFKEDATYIMPLPVTLFSYESLGVLKLDFGRESNHVLQFPVEVSLPNLKVLHVKETEILDDHFDKLVSSLPVLEDLVLVRCYVSVNKVNFKFIIFSATLKRLTMFFVAKSFLTQEAVPFHFPQIVINAPALVYLNTKVQPAEFSLALEATQSLVEAVIEQFGDNNARDVLEKIKNVQSLQVRDSLIQCLCDFDLGLPLFKNLTYLKICDWGFIYNPCCLEFLLAECVVLRTLVFYQQSEFSSAHKTVTRYVLLQSRLTELLCHLKTVKFELLVIEDVVALFKVIEFFLMNSEVLEELTLRVKDFPDTQRLEVMKRLSTLPRVPKNCEVFICE